MNGRFACTAMAAPMHGKSSQQSLAILVGGHARRLGTDKGLFAPLGDETLLARCLRLLSADFQEVLVVCRDGEQARLYSQVLATQMSAHPGVRVVHDQQYPGQYADAALCGIITGLAAATNPQLTVVPVDQLGVRQRFLQALSQSHADAMALAFHDDAGDSIPFPSRWSTTSRNRLEALRDQGALSVQGALREMNAHLIPAGEWTADLEHNGNTLSELQSYLGQPLHDSFARRMHYLRFSLTEACNMSCTYCLPDGFPEWYRHKARLGNAEIKTILGGFRQLGFRKVRFTGGEPTVHPQLRQAISWARQLGYEKITMTTNGALINDLKPWVDAGLDELNLSLDSLRAETFQQLTKSKTHAKVMGVIDQAIALGIPLKINTVLMRSQNAVEVDEMITWALQRPLTLRFIELMPTGLNRDFASRERVLNTELLPKLQSRGLSPIGIAKGIRLSGPATEYGGNDYLGRIGFISPLSCNFCGDCNRLRVTARGQLRLCLFGDEGHALNLSSADSVAADVRRLLTAKTERHHLEEGNSGNVETFRNIGG